MSWNTRREKTIQRQVEQGVVTPFIQKNTDAKFATRTRPGAEGSIMSAAVEGMCQDVKVVVVRFSYLR